MQKSFLKGVTPALGVILLSAITVGVVSTAFYGISSLTEKTQNETSGLIEHEFDVMGAKLKIDVFGDCKIYLANTGTKDIPIEVIGFYVAEPGTETYESVTTSPTTGTIKKDATQEITFTGLSTGKHKLIVKIYGNRMDYGYLTCTELICGDTGENNWYVAGQSDCDQCDFAGSQDADSCTDLMDSDCGGVETSCTDGTDNDCDGLTDGADPDCAPDCGDGTCDPGENCPADASACSEPAVCMLRTCVDGCNNPPNPKSSGTQDTDGSNLCDDTHGCASPPCQCDGSGNCVSTAAPVTFSCHIESGGCSTDTAVLALSGEENAHAELKGGGGYSQKLCCSNISSVQTTTGTGDCKTVHGSTFTGLVTFSGDTNAQVEKYNLSSGGFDNKKNICVELTSGGLDCNTISGSCPATAEFIFKISGNTNAHIGDSTSPYPMKVCCTS